MQALLHFVSVLLMKSKSWPWAEVYPISSELDELFWLSDCRIEKFGVLFLTAVVMGLMYLFGPVQ